jgi:pimeloyl-ACP methyl ester carboxylesterase
MAQKGHEQGSHRVGGAWKLIAGVEFPTMRPILLFSVLCCFAVPGGAAAQETALPRVERKDFYVPADRGIRLFVREVTSAESKQGKPVLLIHGARVPGLASFDLQVRGGSLAEDLAVRGFDVYVMDVRGYGASTRPKEMNERLHPAPLWCARMKRLEILAQ